jgi:cell volume regulation protein A
MDIDLGTGNILLLGSILLFGSILAGKAGSRFGIPALLLFLGVGMLFGSDGVGINFDSVPTAQFIGMMALSIILFSGGMDTKFTEIKPVLGQGVILATAGVLLTAGITGAFIYLITGKLHMLEALLLASIMSSTDSASVFSILRSKKQGLKQRLRPMLELESGSNDPMAYMLTILLIEMFQTGEGSIWASAWMFFVQMGVGALAGLLLGRLAIRVINRINIDNRSMYGILLLAFVFFIFSITDLVHGNGYLAVYIAGLVVGNSKIVFKRSIMTFFDGFTWLFQIVLFLTLGLLVNPHELLEVWWIGLAVGVFMIVVSRPLSVFACLAPFRNITTKGKLFVSWVGLRGAVPIIFATYPLLMLADVEIAKLIFNLVFLVTIISLLTQGTTVSWMAKLLGLATEEKTEAFGIDLPDKVRSALSEIDVQPVLLAHSDRLRDLILPDNTLVVMIKRGDNYFVPRGSTKLDVDDKLLVISDNSEELRKEYDSLGLINPLQDN